MQTFLKSSLVLLIAIIGLQPAYAQKKVKHIEVTHLMPHSAEKVWALVGGDYGAVANSHPRIVYSEYINGSLKAEVGAQRRCDFNEKGSQYVKEEITAYDPQNMTLSNKIYQAGKFPVDPDVTYGTYKIIPIDENSSRFVFNMYFRTKPGFLGGMMKGSFTKLIQDYALAIEHHISTGEKVTRDNFKEVKKSMVSR